MIMRLDHSPGHCEARWRATWAPPGGQASVVGGRPGWTQGAGNALDPTEVREWAKAQGIEVKDRGRVPAELVARFKAATGKLGPECCRLAKTRRSHSHAE